MSARGLGTSMLGRLAWRPLVFGLLVLGLLGGGAGAARADVQVEARLAQPTLTVGEATTLEVVVRGIATGVRDPQFDVPEGVEVLSSGRSQNFSWMNGQSSVQTVFRFEIAAVRGGTFSIGPILVTAGDQAYQSPLLILTVTAERARVGGASEGGPAELIVDITPSRPYVGQPVVLRVRLIQRATLAEDPRYTPPPTPGFWAERASQPESYYADQAGQRVLVTETRTRLYPLAAGTAEIGPASTALVFARSSASPDPLSWLGGGARREVEVRSAPVKVAVRALPPNAPPEFEGAVGTLSIAWGADRVRTPADVPLTAWLEIRGVGNLPLLRAPTIASPNLEVFANTVEDSLGPPGASGAGRRRFQWTVLPRRSGTVALPAPAFAWFDPSTGAYAVARPVPLTIEVTPPIGGRRAGAETFSDVFLRHPIDPFRRPAEPWGLTLAGVAIAAGVRLMVGTRGKWRSDSSGTARAQLLARLRLTAGATFLVAAAAALDWLAARGRNDPELRREIGRARFGGAGVDLEAVRARLVAGVSEERAASPPGWPPAALGVVLVAAGIGASVWAAPRPGPARAIQRAVRADQAALVGDVDEARGAWRELWRAGARHAGLAARLAWAEIRDGSIGSASLWVLRGDRDEPRDPGLQWVIGQIHDAGGLTGFGPTRGPLRTLEWGLVGFALGVACVWLWPRRIAIAVCAAVAAVAASYYPLASWWGERAEHGAVLTAAPLDGGAVELEPGQVVRIDGRPGGRVRVTVGRGVAGWLPADAVGVLERP